MDYFTDLLATFLDADRVNYNRCQWEDQRALRMRALKMNEGLTGLERHEGE